MAGNSSRRKTGGSRVDICMLSSIHPAYDKRVFEKEGKSLAGAGYSVIHLCPGRPEEAAELHGVRIDTYANGMGKLRRLAGMGRLYKRARTFRARAYHCNEPDSWAVGVALRATTGATVVFDCHEHYPGQVVRWLPAPLRLMGPILCRVYMELMALLTDRIVLAKRSVAADMRLSRRRHLLVRNTTPIAALGAGRVTTRNDAVTRDDPFTFVHIGVIRRERGTAELLAAMAELRARGIAGYRVRIIGEFKDGSEAAFFDQAERTGVRELIEFHQWMPFAEAFDLVRRSHAGLILFQRLLANNVYGLPHKLFDYMVAGLPVIAPDFAPEIAAIIDHTRCGHLIDTGDAKALADGMQRMIEDPEAAQESGRRGQQAVLEEYNWEADAKKLIGMYEELIGMPVRPPAVTV